MSTTRQEPWITGWTASDPLQIGFISVAHDERTWEPGLRPYLEYRDLGLAEVTGGKLGAQHVRSRERASSDWHCHDLDFQFFYVVKGSITIENEKGDTVTLGPGDTGYQPGLFWHRETITEGYEVVEITGPAKGETITGRESPLPARASTVGPDRDPFYSLDRDENYELGKGPRSFFKYRDLGTATRTDGRIHLHVVRATGAPGEGTGWHYHSMAQWFMIVGGTSDIRVETRPRQKLVVGDTMCIGSGPRMRHDVAPFSGDYAVLEMCVPAEYQTVAVDPPEGAAD
jgi:quercetin dioxygenase-like cupin family protein